MKQIFTAILSLSALLLSQNLLAQIIEGSRASQKVAQSDMLRYKENTSIPTYIHFTPESNIPRSELSSLLKYQLGLRFENDFEEINHSSDQLGMFHERFRQLYKGVEVEGSMFMVHSKNQKITAINGDVFDDITVSTTPTLSEKAAIEKAISHTNASKYMWEDDNTFPQPTGKLVIAPKNGDYDKIDWHLCYKIDIYAVRPYSRNWVLVDAHTGEIVWEMNQLHTADAPATGTTHWSGVRSFTADSYNGSYRLRESGRSGIRTMDMNTGTNYGAAVDFTDSDNNWTSTTNMDDAARDAHWGAEMTYDFYKNSYNRNSIDDNGMDIISYIHYDAGYQNAFWNGQAMTFGDGNSQPFTSMDIMAHELTHGVTGNTAGLQYQNESGALNESFSDIFGTAVEFYAKPSQADWLIAGDFGTSYFRSMSNPKAKNNPDTYLGIGWYTGTTDNGGVHSNSGVQNKWYYLASMGGTGTNDLGNTYNVVGVGVTDAAAVAYRNLTVYLTPTSKHIDARFYSTIAAIDLFGTCSPQLAAVTNAWYAVGVGLPYQQGVTADFTSPLSALCLPGTVTFYNYSSNASTFKWNFGDGSPTVTNNNPMLTHTYSAIGNYNVTLIANGGACGIDTTVKTAFVSVGPSNPCVVMTPTTGTSTQTNCTGTVFDNGGENANYLPDTDGKIIISPTNAYQIDLTFSKFRLDSKDTLYIYDGNSTNAPLIGYYTIKQLEGNTLSSSGGKMMVRFRSNSTAEDSGFVYNWACRTMTTAPQAEFAADEINSCDGIIHFFDQSTQGGANWKWNFGDGSTANNVENPVHEYTQNGTYTVKLKVSNPLGTDSIEKQTYITVNRPSAPTATNALSCGNMVTLTGASTSGPAEINWFSANGNWLGVSPYNIINPVNNTSYTAKSYVFGPFANGGRLDNVGPGAYIAPNNETMIFETVTECMLHAVDVYAETAGSATIQYQTEFGVVIASRNVNLQQGYNKVLLNFPLQLANKAKLAVINASTKLYRNLNLNGASYPFAVSNYVKIKGSSTGSLQQYFYFYNWEVAALPCISLPTSVQVQSGGASPQAQFSTSIAQSTVDFDASASTNSPIYKWNFGDATTGTGATVTHNYTAIGTYNVQLITQNGGCYDTTTQTIEITSLTTDVDMPTLSQSLQLFPNPGNGTFFLKWNGREIADLKLQVFNGIGQSVYHQSYTLSPNFKEEIQLPTQAEGIYWIQIQVGNEQINIPYLIHQ